MNYTNWYAGQPDFTDENERCMNLYTGRNYTWNDLDCSQRICSVCELKI